MYDNNQAKPNLVLSGAITLTDKKDRNGNPAGLKGGCVISLKGKDGQMHQCLLVPLESNPTLYYNEKDKSVSLDINIYENATVKYGQTHFIRPSLGKRAKTMSEQARREATPIIGNLKPFTPGDQNQQQGPQNLGGNYSPYAQQPQGAPQTGYGPQGGYGPQSAPQGGYGPQGGYAPQGAAPQGGYAAPQQPQQQQYAPAAPQAPAGGDNLNPGVEGDLPF